MSNKTFYAKHLRLIGKEIASLRDSLDSLEKRASEGGVINAFLLTSISESATSLIYNVGMNNGAELSDKGNTAGEIASALESLIQRGEGNDGPTD